ncbi:hypothetical protein EMIT093MI4_190031 [Pseudomonas sp. IT-93MI4]
MRLTEFLWAMFLDLAEQGQSRLVGCFLYQWRSIHKHKNNPGRAVASGDYLSGETVNKARGGEKT